MTHFTHFEQTIIGGSASDAIKRFVQTAADNGIEIAKHTIKVSAREIMTTADGSDNVLEYQITGNGVIEEDP